MKVAQQFIAGLAFILRIVPLGTIDNRFLPCVASVVNGQAFPSSLRDGHVKKTDTHH
jgi:hypothetical protein